MEIWMWVQNFGAKHHSNQMSQQLNLLYYYTHAASYILKSSINDSDEVTERVGSSC